MYSRNRIKEFAVILEDQEWEGQEELQFRLGCLTYIEVLIDFWIVCSKKPRCVIFRRWIILLVNLQNLLLLHGRTIFTEMIYTYHTMPYQKLRTNAIAQPPSQQKDAGKNEGGQAMSHGCCPSPSPPMTNFAGTRTTPDENGIDALSRLMNSLLKLRPLKAVQAPNNNQVPRLFTRGRVNQFWGKLCSDQRSLHL